MPLLSVIIATRNRCYLLPRALKSILNQKLKDDFGLECLVVDNNSSDRTREVVDSFLPLFNGKLCYVLETEQGKSVAVNRGIKESRGEILAFTDDDAMADDYWLANIVDCFQQYHCDGVGGRVLAEYPPHTPAWVKENADILMGPIVLYDYGQETKPYARPMYQFVGVNFAFKRSLFEECGYLQTNIGPGKGTLGDDTELINRFMRAGKKLYYCGKAVVWHPVEEHRMRLSFLASWNAGLGRYRVIIDEQGIIDQSLVYWFGVPRYLAGEIMRDSLRALCHIFNKRKFLELWTSLSRNWGRAMEMRRIYHENNAAKND